MRRQLKTQLTELIGQLRALNRQLLIEAGQGEAAALGDALADEQDAMISVGNRIEAAEGEGTEAVRLLERGCEVLWRISQAGQEVPGGHEAVGQEEPEEHRLSEDSPLSGDGLLLEDGPLSGNSALWELLDQLLSRVCEEIEGLPEQIVAVFLPYKASMWDCMESVWRAASADPGCIAYVVPVPYFDLKDGEVVGRHYEGYNLPDYVPVVDYRKLSLEELQPEMVFVHNPFDDCNLVTRLLPEYFSENLKKYTRKLVYIPYYVTGDAVYVTHRYQPSYHNFDYIVTQSEKMIDSYDPVIPREKFLPFGSPVADRILYMEEHKLDIPEEWKPMLPNGRDFGGRRTVMLNTSISLLLQQRGRFLDKLEYIFRLIRGMNDILLIWRPHPLLRATAESLASDLAERLRQLEDMFLKEKLGVLDREPDVGVTVALCDAYLGETASSMIHMFGIAGKPRFYINLIIPGEGGLPGEAGGNPDGLHPALLRMNREGLVSGECMPGRKLYRGADGSYRGEISCSCRLQDREYFILNEYGWIVERKLADGAMRPVAAVPGFEIYREDAYSRMEAKGEELAVYPKKAEGIVYYNLRTGGLRKVFGECLGQDAGEPQAECAAREGQGTRELRAECAARESQVISESQPERTPQEGSVFRELPESLVAAIRAGLLKKGNLDHTWHEGDACALQDYFYFLQTAGEDELRGYTGTYQVWLATMDGTCGEKVYGAVKEAVLESCRPEE